MRAPPPSPSRLQRIAADLFGTPLRVLATLLVCLLAGGLLWQVLDWAVLQATFVPDSEVCRAHRQGACWGVVMEKWRALLFARYPWEQQWRAAIAGVLLVVMTLTSGVPRCWRLSVLLPMWGGGLAWFVVLMRGGVLGLEEVPTNLWGGLPLTISLTVLGLSLAFPLALALALGRRSQWPVVRVLCATFIELVRGVPLISVLFMASFLLPLIVPDFWKPDVFLRVLFAMVIFIAAYMAEVLRAGLQAVPSRQVDAARALGLGRWGVQRYVVLPQALRIAIPALTNIVIGSLKDTSLVTVVGMFELTGALAWALGGDVNWRPFYLEGYVFIALLYWLMCTGLGRYGRWLEQYGVARR